MIKSNVTLDGHVFTCGDWTFEIKSIIARKTKNYGEPFSGVANISIVDGKIHIEAMHCDSLTKSDCINIQDFIKSGLEFKEFQYSRYSLGLVSGSVIK